MKLSKAALDLFSQLLGAEFQFLCEACTDSDEEKAKHEQTLDELFALLSVLRNRQ